MPALRNVVSTDLSMLQRLVDPAGKDVLDVGCGDGALVRELAARGARVVGLETSEEQLASAIADDGGSGASYVVGHAQELPIADASFDIAVFMRTLHHVLPGDMARALREARRVMRAGGVVYVAEPLSEGDYFALMSLVEDELDVRRAAQEALDDAVAAGLDRMTTVDYTVKLSIPNLEALRARIVSVDPGRREVFDTREAELIEAFGKLGEDGEAPGERCFPQPMRADVLQPRVTAARPDSPQPAPRMPLIDL